jgi:hypothetical protein
MGWGQGQFGWGTFGSEAPQFDVTDKDVMNALQLSVLEPADDGQTWPSGLWNTAEIVSYMNNRSRSLLCDSGLTVAIGYSGVVTGQDEFDLPDNLIDIRRVAWAIETDPMAYTELPIATGWELDHDDPNWPTASAPAPEVYTEDTQQSLTISVNPKPTDTGEMELIFTALGGALTGTGSFLSIPDDYTPYIAWGARADMLSSEYEVNDPARAAHCESRFQEGLELARILVSGG